MKHAPIVVVGSGGAGLAAALSASRNGANVMLLEAAPVIGGTTAMSGGGIWVPGNRLAADEGIVDSPEAAEAYIRRVTLGTVPHELIASFVEHAPEALDFLIEEGAYETEVAATPDYQAHFEGALNGGRQVSTGLFDTARLGAQRNLLRPLPPGGTPPLRQSEQKADGWGIGGEESGRALEALARQRRSEGIAGRGNALVAALLAACIRAGVEIVTDTRAERLSLDPSGSVDGIFVTSQERTSRMPAKAVILATGGFEWNLGMWNQFVGVPLDGPLSPPFNRGDGLAMAVSAGAALRNMSSAWWVPSIHVTGDTLDGAPIHRFFNFSKGFPGAIAVNPSGRRFGNESMNYHDFGQVMAQFDPHSYSFPNLPTWIIMDEEHVTSYRILDRITSFGEDWLVSGDLNTLSAKIGVDRRGLEQQLATFNAAAESGNDPVYHRGESAWETYRADPQYQNPSVRPLQGPRFYAYRQTLSVFGTNGGPDIGTHGQVLRQSGEAIPGLYAAGNAAACVFGRAYPGGGATLGNAVTFGYLAGLDAARL